jgi:ABC-2 type transport system ATP-binding protein
MTHAIQVEGLSRHFGAVKALDGLSFDVERGEVFGVLGHNGAGKTTLVRVLNGVLEPSGGRAHVLGYDSATEGSEIRRRTGVLTETPSLYERLSARDNLRTFGTLYDMPPEAVKPRADEMLALFKLTDRARDKAGGFSKGMKQRLALARALMHSPEILFLDEPTAGLDPEASRSVMTLIENLSREGGRTIFLCTHNLDEAQRLCDRVAVLGQGKLLALGTTAQLGRDLWRALWVDFELDAPADSSLIGALRALPTVIDVSADGSTLAVQLNADEQIPGLVSAVANAGALIRRVNPREHSLEEIYFELQRRNSTAKTSVAPVGEVGR